MTELLATAVQVRYDAEGALLAVRLDLATGEWTVARRYD